MRDRTEPDPDHCLVERARQDSEAFGELYDRYLRRIYAYVASRVGAGPDAEDLVAEAFLRALRQLPRFEDRGDGSFAAWLFRITHNLVTNFGHRNGNGGRVSLSASGDLPDGGPPLDDGVLGQERAAQLRQLVQTLSRRRQEIVNLRFFGGLRNREIAAVLGVDERTVAAHLCRALDDLRQKYVESTGLPEDGRVR